MISISRDGSEVVVTLETGCETAKVLNFKMDTGNHLYAELLSRKLRETLAAAVEEVRRHEYEAGWSDKAKKKLKTGWFSSNLKYRRDG